MNHIDNAPGLVTILNGGCFTSIRITAFASPAEMPLNRRKFLTLASLSTVGVGFNHHRILAQSLQAQPPIASLIPTPQWQFIAVGDVGTGDQAQYDVAQAMVQFHQRNPFALALLAGDNIYDGGEMERIGEVFEQPYGPLLQHGITFHAVLGNHDVMSQRGEGQIRYPGFNMAGRYYTFTRDSVQFFALDTNPGPHWSAQLRWLEAELARSKANWKIVLGHHPIYASGLHSIKWELASRLGPLLGTPKLYPGLGEQLTPLFAKYQVQLYINGHEHHYERTQPIAGTTYLTCGVGSRLRPTGSSEWTAFASSQLGFAAIAVYDHQLVINGIGVNSQYFDHGIIDLTSGKAKT